MQDDLQGGGEAEEGGIHQEWSDRLNGLLQSEIVGHPLLAYSRITSTNDVARDHAQKGAPDGCTVVASVQTLGRGRRGRAWVSYPDQAVYLSVVLRPAWHAADVSWLGILGGVAAADALAKLGVQDVQIKWPNDVLVRGRKIAGVLVEPRLHNGAVEFAIIGIGLNVRQQPADWGPELAALATSCLMERVDIECDAAICTLLQCLDDWYVKTKDGNRDALLKEWSRWGGTERLPVLD